MRRNVRLGWVDVDVRVHAVVHGCDICDVSQRAAANIFASARTLYCVDLMFS